MQQRAAERDRLRKEREERKRKLEEERLVLYAALIILSLVWYNKLGQIFSRWEVPDFYRDSAVDDSTINIVVVVIIIIIR